jgi:hypothetical protein
MVKKEDLHDALSFIQTVMNAPDKDEPEKE